MKLRFAYPDTSQLDAFLATQQYENIWKHDGQRIIEAFTKWTGLMFRQQQITVRIHNDRSMSGTSFRPMRLSIYNLTVNEKRAALLHELGHRLLGGNHITSKRTNYADAIEEDERYLGLFMLDVYADIYGPHFVKEYLARASQIVHEGGNEYAHSLADGVLKAQSLTLAERQHKLQQLIMSKQLEW